MTAIKQNVLIDESRRFLRLEKPLPETVGTGQAEITLVISEKPPEKTVEAGESPPAPVTDMLCGLLAHVGDISKEEIREERLKKWLC